MTIKNWAICISLTIGTLITGNAYAQDAKANPDFIYFDQGDTPENWTWVLADPDNWWLPIEGNSGRSKSGKVNIQPASYQAENDAVRIIWNRKDKWGSAAIAGRTTDLTKFENQAELLVVLKVKRHPRKEVKLTMSCGDECNADIFLDDILRGTPADQWFALPIPLNCFSKKGANLANITTPFSIGTNGPLEMSIASVRIQPMAEGEKGCTAENPEGTE